MLACPEQTASLGLTIEVWGPRSGSCWGFSSSLDTTRFSCSQFSFQRDGFCYRAKAARFPGCRSPNPLVVLPGVFNASAWDWESTRGSPGCSLGLRHCRWVLGAISAHLGLEFCLHRLHQRFLLNGATPSRLGCDPNRPIALAQLLK